MMYTLKVGTVFEDTWSGNLSSTGLLFKSVEDAEKVIELAHPPAWVISQLPEVGGAWHDIEVKVSPMVEKERKKDKEARQKYLESTGVLVDVINKQPTEVPLHFGLSLDLVIQRETASYDPQISRRIMTPIRCKLVHDGREVLSYFWPGDFISKNGGVLAKKLHNFCNWHGGLNPGDVDCLAEKLKMVRVVIDRLQNGTYNSRDFSTTFSKKGSIST